MALDPEISQAIIDAIKEQIPQIIPTVVGEAIKPVSEQLEKQQRDYKKLNDFLTKTTQSLTAQDEKLTTLSSSLEILEEIKQQKLAEDTEKTQSKGRRRKQVTEESIETEEQKEPVSKKQDIDIDALRQSLMTELKQQYEGRVNEIQRQLEERDKETQALREADRRARMKNEVLNTMRGLNLVRPNTEEDLLTLLEKRNLIVEDGDRFYVKAQDKFGDPVKAEFKDVLPKMLEEDFAHFAVPRGGTGTGATPTAPSLLAQYNFRNMTAQQIYDAYGANPDASNALIEVLEHQYGKNR